MRNIYEIIEEQKHMVDVNIAFYELEHVNESYIYLTEGSGGGIVKKVVDFIKTIMRKIKELVQKVISLFTGGKSGGGSSSSKKKRYIPEEDLDKEVKLPYIYKASHFEDSFEQGVSLLLDLIESHTDDLDNKLLDDKLKDLYDSFGEHDSVNEVIKQTFDCDINDEKNKLRTLRSVEEKLLSYVNEGDVVATCKKMNKWAQDALNKLLRSVNDNAEKTKVVQHASQLVNLMSQSFLKAIVNSRKIAMQYTVEEGPKNKAEENLWNNFVKAVKENDRRETFISISLAADVSAEKFIKYVKYIDSHNPSLWDEHKVIEQDKPKSDWDMNYLGLLQSDLSRNMSRERASHIIEVLKYTENKKR